MKLLDLCCAEGGATAGYMAAGFTVYAVDMEDKFAKRNPAHGFRQEDALQTLPDLLAGLGKVFRTERGLETLFLKDFDAIHVSPPCQGYSRGNAGRVTSWPKLIPDFRKLLELTGKPYVIENVKDAFYDMKRPVGLCGCMFDLSTIDDDGVRIHLQRLRLFETSFSFTPPRECDHSEHEWVAGAYGGARRDKYEAKYVRKGGYVPPNKAVVAALLGIEHDMTWNGLYESLPPAYTKFIGLKIMEML